MSSTITLKINQQTTLSLSPVDNSGSFAPITGIPSWTQTNSGIAELRPAPSGMSAIVIGKNVGTTIVTARSTGSSGTLSVSTTINVITNLANIMAMTAGPVTSKPTISTSGSLGMNPNIALQKIQNYNMNPARPLSSATPGANKMQAFKPPIHQPPKGTVVLPQKPTVRTKQDKHKQQKEKPKVPELKMPVLTLPSQKDKKPEIKKPEIKKPEIKPLPKPHTTAPVTVTPLTAITPTVIAPPIIPPAHLPHVHTPPVIPPHLKPTPSDTIKQAMAQVKRSGGCGCGGRR
jgi:hypothetical protein